MLFDLINPSDPYTFEAPDLKTAAVVVCILGQGKFAAQQMDGDAKVPLFLFGDHDEWFTEQFGQDLATALDSVTTKETMPATIDTLESVLIGDREVYEMEVAKIPEADRKAFRAKWHDERRTSMCDIGGAAQAQAAHLRKRLANGQVE